jgi:hypothetical protein
LVTVNLVGVLGDCFLDSGSSSLLGSGVNYNLNVLSVERDLTYLGNGISTDQFLFNTTTGFVFGAKGNGLENALKTTNSSEIFNTTLSNTIYSLPSNGLSRAYEEKNK